MNKNSLVKLALIRYALLPRQLLAFDEGYCKDSHDFNMYFSSQVQKAVSLAAACEFVAQISPSIGDISYQAKCQTILKYIDSLPFLDASSFTSL